MSMGKNKSPFFGVILLGIFLMFGCGVQPTESPTPSKAELPIASSTPTIAPTNTPIITPTETATIEPTPTSPPYTHCQEIIDAQMPKDFLTEGSIIFKGECEGKEGWYKLSAETRKITPFLNDQLHDGYDTGFKVSPDRQWLAVDAPVYDKYSNYLYSALVITGENDKNIIRYVENREWDWKREWLGNQKLQISLWSAGISEIFLDVFGGKISYQDAPSYWSYYDADLTRALSFMQKSNSYALFNIATGQELWKSKENLTQSTYHYEPYGDRHLWSPDNGMVAFPVWDDENSDSKNNKFVFKFMVVTRDGREIQSQPIKNFGYIFYLDQKPYISFGWSDDSKYLIYWNAKDSGTNQLTYWNPLTNEIIDSGFITHDNNANFPDFSTNEQKFILNASISSDENAKRTNYLVDLSTGKNSQLDINLVPLAWIKTNQEIAKPKQEPFPLPSQKGASVKQSCLAFQSKNLRSKILGALVFSQGRFYNLLYTLTDNGMAALINPKTNPYRTGAVVSPDRKKLFYWYEDDLGRNFGLYSLDGQPTSIELSSEASDNIVDSETHVVWQNNKEIQVGWTNNGILLVNPSTLKYRDVPDFPNMDMLWVCNDDLYCYVDKTEFQPYDGNFERWLYANGGGYALIDRAGNILWKYLGSLAGFNLPKWQPGYKKLGIPMPVNEQDVLGEHYEIFTVDRNGRQWQLTNYSSSFPTMSIDQFSWSPDGRYIAFWGDTHSQESITQQNPYRLFILDTVTQKTVDYCVAGSYSSQYTQNRAPIWSPDGSQIAVNGILGDKRQILLVDFASGTVSPVAEGELIGWMANP